MMVSFQHPLSKQLTLGHFAMVSLSSPFLVIPVLRRWDPRYYFSNKYLRNLLSEKKAKEAPWAAYFKIYW